MSNLESRLSKGPKSHGNHWRITASPCSFPTDATQVAPTLLAYLRPGQPARHIALQSMTLCRSCDHILRFRLCLCIHVVQGTGEVSSAVRASGSRKNLVHSVSHWCGGLRSLPCVWLQLVSLPLCSCPGIPSSRQSGCLVDQYSRDVKSSSSILSVCLWMVGIFCQKEACCWMGEHGWKLEGLCKLCSACAVANGSFPRVLFAL